MLLAIVMALSTVTFTWAEPAAAKAPTKTLGQLLADNYDSLTDSEKDLLKAGLLTEASYTYTAPDANNGGDLVLIDAENKTVTAKAYTNNGYTWEPVSAQLMVNNQAYGASFALTKGENGSYTGSFSFDGTSYGVAVQYKMYITVEKAAQNVLLMAAENLKEAKAASDNAKLGVQSLDQVLQEKIAFSLDDIVTNMTSSDLPMTPIYQIYAKLNKADGGGFPYMASQPNVNRISWIGNGEEDQKQMKALTDDAKDGSLAVKQLWQKNGIAENVNGLCANYVDVKAALDEIYTQATLLKEATSTLDMVTGNKLSNAITAAVKTLEGITADIRVGAEFDWTKLAGLVNSNTDVEKLEKLVEAMAETSGTVASKTELLADTTVVTANMAQATIKVQVKANVYKSGATVADALAKDAGTVRLAAGSSKSAIAQLIDQNGMESSVLKSWEDYDVNDTFYDKLVTVSPSVDTSAGLVDGETYTYTITYTPKKYTITTDCRDILDKLDDGKLPYGYNLTLPVKGSATAVWDYTVNSEAYDEGSVIRIVGNTEISRAEGKAWEIHDLGKMIAQNYAEGDEATGNILGQAALKTGTVRLRTPGEGDDLLTVSENNGAYIVTGKNYHANTGDLYWVPVTATPVKGGVSGTSVPFVGDKATLSEDFDSVSVSYKLALSWADVELDADSATAMLNLPYTLVQEANSQLEALNKLAEQYSKLEEVNKKIGLIRSTIEGDRNMKQESKDAINFIVDNCCNKEDMKLLMYGYVGSYKDLSDADKLAYYYQNNVTFQKQLKYLYDNMNIICADPALKDMLVSADMGEYYEKIDDVTKAMEETVTKLVAPNAAINTRATDASLKELTNAIVAYKNDVKQYEAVTQTPVLTTTLSVAGIGKKNVTVQVVVRSSDGAVKSTQKVDVAFSNNDGDDVVLNAAMVAELTDALAQAEVAAGVDKLHYEQTADSSAIPAEGTKLTAASTKLTVTYTPKQYTVKFVDENGEAVAAEQEFYYDDPAIFLPACTENGFRYDYCIGDIAITATDGRYIFNTAATGEMAFDTLFARGECVVTRIKVDTAREKFMAMVDGMNNAVASGEGMTLNLGDKNNCLRLAFIPYERDGQYTLVVRVSPSTSMKMESVLNGISQELLNYKSILMGDNGQAFLTDGMINLQSLVDVLLNSGLSLDTILNGITADGNLVESKIPGAVMWTPDASKGHAVSGGYVNDLDTIGLQMLQIPTEFDGTKVNVAVTLEDFDRSANDMKKIRDAASTLDNKGISVSLDNGSINVNAASNNAYKLLMGAALLLNQADVSTIEKGQWNLVNIIPDLYDSLVAPIVKAEGSSTTTIQNTLEKFGVSSVDVTKYQGAFKVVKAILKNSTFSDETGSDDSFGTQMNFSMEELLNGISNEGLRDIVKNHLSSTTLSGKLNFGITHTQEYAAVVMHAQKSTSGLVKFIPAANDSSFTVETGNSMVVLMADTCKKITVKSGCNNVIIDLNGHTVDEVICDSNDRVIVINSVLSKGGLVNAGNATDGSALAKTVYSVERTSTTNGENIVLSVIPSLDAWKNLTKERKNVLAVAAELVAEVVMNYGNATKKVSVNIGGQDIVLYDLALDDIADMVDTASFAGTGNILLDCLNLDGINAFANDILHKLFKFENISDAIANSQDILSYTFTTTGFGVTAEVADGDYLNISTKDGAADTVNVSVRVASGEEYSGAIDRIQGILGVLQETVVVDDSTGIEIRDISASGTRDDMGLNMDLCVTFNAKVNARGDINYVIFPAMIVANSLPEGDAMRAELVEGIKDYITTQSQNALKAAVEKVSSKQLISALRALNGKPIFNAQANKLGLNVSVNNEEASKMSAYGDILYAIGRALDLVNTKGNNGTLGSTAAAEYGSYKVEYKDKTFTLTRSAKSFTGTLNGVANVVLDADLFTEEKDIVVKDRDGRVLYNDNDLAEALAIISNATEEVTMVLNKAQSLSGDANVSVPLTVQGKTLEMNGHKFVLKTTDASVTMDGITDAMVDSGVTGWYVDVADSKAFLVQCPVKANGLYYKELDIALAHLNGEGTLEILADVTLTKNVPVTGTLTVIGADKLNQAGFKFVLKNTNSELVSDAAVKTETDRAGYKIKETVANNTYTYTVVEQCEDKGDLYLDVRPEGINAAQLQTALRKILNKSDATVTVEVGGLTDKGLVRNGATVKVASGSDLCRYTIIIVGDTNCNGRTDSGDAVLMRRHFMNIEKLTGAALKAADVNKTGRIDSGDASKNRLKFMSKDWNGYKSSYENKVD